MTGPFDSAWLKWGRAIAHAQMLETELDRFRFEARGQPIATFAPEYDSKRHGFALIVNSVRPMPPILPLLLGDVVHDFRCALDHLTWALYQRGNKAGTLTDDEERRIYFPIARSKTHFKKLAVTRLPGVSRTDRAAIRAGQPYHHGKTLVRWHYLPTLERASNDDKHREIQDLWMVATSLKWHVEPHGCTVTRISDATLRELKIGTELACVYVRKTQPDPHIDVQCEMTAFPSFRQNLKIEDWLHIAAVGIQILLATFAEPPERELKGVGADPDYFGRAFNTYVQNNNTWLTLGRGGLPRV